MEKRSSSNRSVRLTLTTALVTTCALAIGPGHVVDASLEWPSPLAAHPATVSADALPTVQIDGVVWAQEIVGDTVYVGGDFSTARPADAPPGSDEVGRANFLAFDLDTGELLESVELDANAQVRTIEKSPDESRIYVGGDFTSFGGEPRSRIAAVDTATNTVVDGFAPDVGWHVYDISPTADTVYVGGNFTNVGAQQRLRLAAFDTSGALLSWAPEVPDLPVWALRASPDGTQVAIGGSFETLNGTDSFGRGFAVVDAVTGATLPFAATEIIQNGSTEGAITSLHTDGDLLYGSGYTFGRPAGTLEGIFAAEWGDGTVRWVDDCHGDTYAIHAQGPVIYGVGHPHYCGNIGGFGQPDEWEYYRGVAVTKDVAGVVARERLGYTNFEGQPRPDLINFFPAINAGTVTGMGQGPWHVTGNDQYLVMGGEFTNVNGDAQQGLVRFQTREFAANDQGPTLFNATYPIKAWSDAAGTVTINWQANRDRDDADLTYTVWRRTGGAGQGQMIHQRALTAPFWNRPTMTFTDTSAVPGTVYEYRVQVTDGYGNFANSAWTTVETATVGARSAYLDAVLADNPDSLWRFDESDGTTAADVVGWREATVPASVAVGEEGVHPEGGAFGFDGAPGSFVRTVEEELPPHVMSLEAWFRAEPDADGGLLVGFNSSNTQLGGAGSRTTQDRNLYMDASGNVHFGVNASVPVTVTTDTDYRDGFWHHVVGTIGSNGMQLFVDGSLVNSRSDVTNARTGYYGMLRIGGGNLNGFPEIINENNSMRWFEGAIDDVAFYKSVLNASDVAEHYTAAGVEPPNMPPVAAFAAGVGADGHTVDFDATASSDPDGSIVQWSWDFGDGSPVVAGTGAVTTHTYQVPDTFTVTLTVTDDDGRTDQVSADVTTFNPPALTVQVNAAVGAPASSATLTAGGTALQPGSALEIVVDGSIVATATVDGNGTASAQGSMPSGLSAGVHAIVVRATSFASEPVELNQSFIVDWNGNMAQLPNDAAYTGVEPLRVLDTRLLGSKVAADSVYRLTVSPDWNVSPSAMSVVLNATVTDTEGPGFLTLYPCGTERPLASALNYVAGQTVPNAVIVPLGELSEICIYSLAASHVVIDLNGYFSPDADAQIGTATPRRLVDTREAAKLTPGQVLEVQVTGAGLAPDGATAAVLNVAVTEPEAAGFVTLFPCGTQPPTASNVNHLTGQTVANQSFVALSTTGSACIYTLAAVHVVVDLNAWFHLDEEAEMVSMVPVRMLDTRNTAKLQAGQVIELPLAGPGGISGAAAFALNTTITDAEGPGFVTFFPCGSDMPLASSVNFTAGQVVANHTTAAVGGSGSTCIYASVATHVVVDVEGVYIPLA